MRLSIAAMLRGLREKQSRYFFGVLMIVPSCSDAPSSLEPDLLSGVAQRRVTIDFTSFGIGSPWQPDFYKSEGIRFTRQQCGAAGCRDLSVDLFQGDAALQGEPPFGPIRATFTRPVSDLSLEVAPGLQGTVIYVLKAFSASGKLLGTTRLRVTQDFGDPANTGFGYVTVSLPNLPKAAKSFTLQSVFVRSTFPLNTEIPYGIGSISYSHWSGRR
jgi:hypothetical protein